MFLPCQPQILSQLLSFPDSIGVSFASQEYLTDFDEICRRYHE